MTTKDVYKLNRKGWHVKLMKYIWNFNFYDFSHMCPYFWLTILNIFILPFVAFYKILIRPIVNSIGEAIVWMDQKAAEKTAAWEKAYLKFIVSDKSEQEKLVKIDFSRKCNTKYYDVFRRLYDINPALFDMLSSNRDSYWDSRGSEAAEKRFAKEEARQQRKQERRIRSMNNKNLINDILRFVKPVLLYIIYVAAAFVVGFVLYWIGRFFIWMSHLKHGSWITFWHQVLIAAVILAIVVVIVLIVVFFVKRFDDMTCEQQAKLKIIWTPFIAIGRFFAYIGRNIGSFFVFLYTMFKEACPALDWHEGSNN